MGRENKVGAIPTCYRLTFALPALSSQLSVFSKLCIMNTLLHFLLLLCQSCHCLRSVFFGGRILGKSKVITTVGWVWWRHQRPLFSLASAPPTLNSPLHRSDTKLHEWTWNAVSNLCRQFVQDLCRIVLENCRCSWNRSSWRSDLTICLLSENFQIFIAWHRRRSDGARGHNSPSTESLWGEKIPNNVISTFFKTLHLLPKDLRFEHGCGKLVSCPRCHLTSLRPCTMHIAIIGGSRIF